MDVFEFHAQVTAIVPIGIVPEGLRLDGHVDGRVTAGPLSGARITGVDYLLLRTDGVGVVNAREVITTGDGRAVAVHATGYVVPPFPLPPFSEILDPAFTWPDADLPMHGSTVMQSGDLDLAPVNRTVYGWTGTANMGLGEVRVAARSLAVASLSLPGQALPA